MSFARVRAIFIVFVLFFAAVVLVFFAVSRDTQVQTAPREACPAGHVEADLALPEAKDIEINVYNATDSAGLATDVANEFGNRSFTVLEHGNDPQERAVEGVAVLRYGPLAVGAAHVVGAYFLNEAASEFDIERDDRVVDVVIGAEFQQLATPTEFNQSIAAAGNPTLPEGTCEQRE
jgi:hypothetical protein